MNSRIFRGLSGVLSRSAFEVNGQALQILERAERIGVEIVFAEQFPVMAREGQDGVRR